MVGGFRAGWDCFREEKNRLPLPGIEQRSRSWATRSQVAIWPTHIKTISNRRIEFAINETELRVFFIRCQSLKKEIKMIFRTCNVEIIRNRLELTENIKLFCLFTRMGHESGEQKVSFNFSTAVRTL